MIKTILAIVVFFLSLSAYAVKPPNNLTVTDISKNSVSVRWDISDEAIKYNLYINDSYHTTVEGQHNYTFSGLHAGRHSFYVVSVGQGPSFSGRSNIQTAVIGQLSSTLTITAPVNVSAEAVGTAMKVSWAPTAGVEKYNVYINSRYITTTGNTEYLTADLAPGTYSAYIVAVYKQGGETRFSTRSTTVSVTIGTIAEALPITPLLEKEALATAYIRITGYPTNDPYFGIYPMLAKGEDIFLGVGTGLPAANDGSAIFSFRPGVGLKPIVSLHEQGIMSLVDAGDYIFSPGVDPCCGDDKNDSGEYGPYNSEWDWGNAYFLQVGSLLTVKTRNIPNSFHGWGGWYENETDTYYYAGAGTLGDGQTIQESVLTGQLFVSHRMGQDWTLLSDRSNGIGNYRTFDIIGIKNSLYIQYADLDSCGIARSNDSGYTWTRIKGADVSCASRIYAADGERLIFRKAGESGPAFGIVDRNNDVRIFGVKEFWPARSYHFLAQDGCGNFFVSTNDGRVMFTKNFSSWKALAEIDDFVSFNSIAFWPDRNWLVLSTWGSEANLFKVELSLSADSNCK